MKRGEGDKGEPSEPSSGWEGEVFFLSVVAKIGTSEVNGMGAWESEQLAWACENAVPLGRRRGACIREVIPIFHWARVHFNKVK